MSLHRVFYTNPSAVNLDGVVEFKSLPSGLHNVKEDLVYFVHEQYAGISAFVNHPASESDRNAQFVAFGVLVPLSYGRLGRSWLYTQTLQQLARTAAKDVKNTQPLQEFWDQHDQSKAGGSERPPSSPSASPTAVRSHQNGSQPRSRRRGLSTVSAMDRPGRLLPPSHPILSLPGFIDLFGPLVYPLMREALLRKRILLVTSPPVRVACEFVYDVSVLTTISSALAEQLPEAAEPLYRTTPLFIVGVHDIPFLSPGKKSSTADADPDVSETGWIACTTDEILTMKKEIYDVIVELPNSGPRRWPKIKTSEDKVIKATQRDLRRWRALKRALARSKQARYTDEDRDEAIGDDDETAGLLHASYQESDVRDDEAYDEAVEPTSWGELAQSGFMWWASAGERDTALDQEAEQDAVLNGDLAHLPAPPTPGRYTDEPEQDYTPPKDDQGSEEAEDTDADVDATTHMELLAYFHRYSHQIFSAAATAIKAEGDDTEGAPVEIGDDDLKRMGLDSWSEQDRAFVVELIDKYFRRRATVKGLGIECCGMRIC